VKADGKAASLSPALRATARQASFRSLARTKTAAPKREVRRRAGSKLRSGLRLGKPAYCGGERRLPRRIPPSGRRRTGERHHCHQRSELRLGEPAVSIKRGVRASFYFYRLLPSRPKRCG